MQQIRGRRFDTSEPVHVHIDDADRIARIEPLAPTDEELLALPWISPGWIDLQVNGFGGREFASEDLTVEHVAQVAQAMRGQGVTRFCPTVTTQRLDVMTAALTTIDDACRQSRQLTGRIPGIHLEGPFIWPEDGPRGAHPRDYCREPDWDLFQRLQETAGGRIRIMTMAVDFERSADLIRRVTDTGVVVGIGHTAASARQIARAVDAGARLSTHLGNGCAVKLPRHDNHLWPQLADDRLVAALIADGHHLPPSVLKTFIQAKTPSRCILTSDLSGQAGQPPGVYPSDFCDVEILPNGRLVVAGQRELLAGASQPIGVGIARVMHDMGLDLATTIAMAVDQPAALLGIEPPRLSVDCLAELVMFERVEPDDPSRPERFRILDANEE